MWHIQNISELLRIKARLRNLALNLYLRDLERVFLTYTPLPRICFLFTQSQYSSCDNPVKQPQSLGYLINRGFISSPHKCVG